MRVIEEELEGVSISCQEYDVNRYVITVIWPNIIQSVIVDTTFAIIDNWSIELAAKLVEAVDKSEVYLLLDKLADATYVRMPSEKDAKRLCDAILKYTNIKAELHEQRVYLNNYSIDQLPLILDTIGVMVRIEYNIDVFNIFLN